MPIYASTFLFLSVMPSAPFFIEKNLQRKINHSKGRTEHDCSGAIRAAIVALATFL